MKVNEKIVLYGAGACGKKLLDILDFCNFTNVVVIDSNEGRWQSYINNHKIESPDILSQLENFKWCISVNNESIQNEIRSMLVQEYELNIFNELSYMDLILYAYNRVDIKKFGINNINISKIENWSVIFDCEYGLVLGGIEEWTKGICTEFIKKGEMKSYILSNYGDYKIPNVLRNNILRADVNPMNAFLPNNMKELLKCLVNNLPCTLVTSQPNEVLVAGSIIKRYVGSNIQIISGIRGGSEEIYNNYFQMKACTDLYVCVSSDITRNMIMRGISEDKVLTMICPISYPEVFKKKYTINYKDPIRIGYAGRIVKEQKRMDLMINLIDILENNNLNYYLEFAGEGDYEQNIKEYVRKNFYQEKIKLVGHLGKEEIANFWLDKDVCLNLADYEGRSRSIAEAMANGAVPIVTETSGVHDDIYDKVNGFIVPIGDCEKMANCLINLESNRELLPIMGEKAHLEIKNKSSMENHYQFWIKIINDWKKKVI